MERILRQTRALAETALACHRQGRLCFWLPGAPPEKVRQLDNRTDIYRIGAVLFQALSPDGSGYQPSDYEQLGPLLASKHLPQEVQQHLLALLRRCLSPRPQGRYGCCEELLEALDLAIAALTAPQKPSAQN